MQPATQAWWFAAGRLFATVLIGAGAGWLFGNPWGGLACALIVHLGWVLANLFRLEWWLRHRNYADPPEVGGVWGEIIAQVVRLHRRKRFHKQRFVQLMRQLQRSTAALPNGVVILNAQREIMWFNPMAARLLQLRRTDDLGMRIANLLREPEFVRYLAAQDYANPVMIRPATGEGWYLSMQVVPYGDGQLLLLVSDVSRQMRLEAVRRDFVANASHELRSPLTVICGYLETLGQDPALAPDLQGPVAEMRRQAERMTGIIRDLIGLSRLEESEEIVGGAPIEVAALLSLLRKDVLARAVHPHEVRVRIDSGALLIGDEPEINSAFSNLVDNAAKYTAPEGSIDMHWWVDAGGAHLAVTDTG
ncbi:MAG: phosphate regulon sensor protein PhoR, partial [Steroidobacteraceae bacterium]